MDVFSIMMQIALFTITVVGYLIVFGRKRTKSGHYSQPGWNYLFKKLYAIYVLKKWKAKNAPASETNTEDVELPSLSGGRSWDSLSIKASAPDGTLVHLVLRQHQNGSAELVVQLALPDGTVYKLGKFEEPAEVLDDKQWSAGGLKFVLLEPFQRWRILYNGLLCKGGSDQPTHIRLNFIWTAASRPVRYPQDWSEELASKALATEPWRNGHWLNVLEACPSGSGWEQWGCLQGLLRIEDQAETVVRARGVCERWAAPSVTVTPSLQIRRAFTLLAAARDGAGVHLRGISHSDPGLPTQAISGTIRNSNCLVESITSTNISMPEFCENEKELPPCYTITVGGTRQYMIVLDIELSRRNILKNGGLYGLDSTSVPVQITINGDPGYGLLVLGYASETLKPPSPGNPQSPRLTWTPMQALPDTERGRYCAHFARAAASCPELVGGKGASLALLASVDGDEYSVPPGFCLTTHALNRHIAEHSELRSAVQDIVRVNELYSEARLKEKCERAVQAFSETAIEGDVRTDILTHLAELRQTVLKQKLVDDIVFAVRSSAVGEDSEELSAAGQNDTVLGCRDDEQVLRGVQKCWASLYSFHSTQYRRTNGQVVNSGMGVVVQAVIPARAAGVLFSRHPNTGHPNKILLTANYGLGESVVSGHVDPDTITLERLASGNIVVSDTVVGNKSHRVVVNSAGSTEEVELSRQESEAACLTEDECVRLGRLAVTQERLWRAPRDIEWAIYKDKIYLVQARPITSLERWTEFELCHELDTPVMSEEDLFTYANTGEVMPGALTPLTVDLVGDALKRGSYRTVNRAAPPGLIEQNPFFSSHYHYGINMYNTMYKNVDKDISITNRVIEMAVHGHEVTDERIHSIASKRNPTRRLANLINSIKFTLLLFKTGKVLRSAKDLVQQFIIDTVEFEDPRDMVEELEKAQTVMEQMCLYHTINSSGNIYSQVVAMSVLLEGASKFTMDHLSDIGLMLSSCTDVVSAEVPNTLADISSCIHKLKLSGEFCQLPPSQCIHWLENNCLEAHDKLKKFLKDQSHRNIKEFDLATKTWGLDPTSLIQSIQSAVKAKSTQTQAPVAKPVMSSKEISQSLISPKSNVTRFLLRLILPLCQRTVAHREGTKAQLIMAVHKLRLACLKLGRIMTREWMLPDEELVFYFTLRELRRYIETRDPGIIRKASQRRQYFPSWNALKFTELNEGYVQPLSTHDPRLEQAGSGAQLRGTPVCSGDIIGRACVVTNLSEINQLQRGDILITHSTDIGWSPYFPLLGGVVTELGGLISHGAVIAREYGLPCIVGAGGATSFCRTGDLVLLAGSTGILEKIDPVDSAKTKETT